MENPIGLTRKLADLAQKLMCSMVRKPMCPMRELIGSTRAKSARAWMKQLQPHLHGS